MLSPSRNINNFDGFIREMDVREDAAIHCLLDYAHINNLKTNVYDCKSYFSNLLLTGVNS